MYKSMKEEGGNVQVEERRWRKSSSGGRVKEENERKKSFGFET